VIQRHSEALPSAPAIKDPLENGLAFATIWSTGQSTERDRIFRLSALKCVDGQWSSFDSFCRPFQREDDDAKSKDNFRATKRMATEFGVEGPELSGCDSAEELWPELRAFIEGLPTIVLDRYNFESWGEALGGAHAGQSIGISEVAELLCPGRLASLGEGLVEYLLPSHSRPKSAIGPKELRATVGVIVGSFLEYGPAFIALAHHGYEGAARHLGIASSKAADSIDFCLALTKSPSTWSSGEDELFPLHPGLIDGAASAACEVYPTLSDVLYNAEPAWKPDGEDDVPTLRIEPKDAQRFPNDIVFPPDELRLLDEIFEVHLPKLFGNDTYRQGQHQVAQEVAKSLGGEELLLVHAPTGTGKTLAYLIPAMMWAARQGVRVGIATFTRALQEQAMDREVPLALELLRRSGSKWQPRIAMLKGRRNYLCWRALELQTPRVEDDALRRIAWTRLALFALIDIEGDIDRIPRHTELPFAAPVEVSRTISALLRQCRAESGCCKLPSDRDTCAASIATRNAERAHVVVTNHSYALARQGFFQYLVFDECEHLHDQAHSAWSHVLPFHAARELLSSLRQSGSQKRLQPLDRLRRAAPKGTEARNVAESCCQLQDGALDALDLLELAVGEFKGWRASALRERGERDQHSLFREFIKSEHSADLIGKHGLLTKVWNQLASSLATLSEYLDVIQVNGKRRLRRSFDLIRTDIDDFLLGIAAWIPRDDEGPAFRSQTFYDLESDSRGRDAMSARVLLPHEYLGRYYFPELKAGICISATTHLGGGFEKSAAYLGLERAANPAPDEDRDPSPFRTFMVPAPFDYNRVLVAIPRDAPTFRNASKDAYLDYLCKFVTTLGEKTRGRMLVLFTNANDCIQCGQRVEGFFKQRGIPFYYQRMEGSEKEELAERFRSRTDSILFGLDTFWYGADFPGETLQYLVITKLPYGVPDRYHQAQCAAIGPRDQRRLIYMPRALAKFRQGFGRLMRKESDKGCVFILDARILDPRHRSFLKELPLEMGHERDASGGTAQFVRGETDRVQHEALAHMGMLSDVRRHETNPEDSSDRVSEKPARASDRPADVFIEVPEEDVPF
jgi:ATP-dependent DNA helicase DinG